MTGYLTAGGFALALVLGGVAWMQSERIDRVSTALDDAKREALVLTAQRDQSRVARAAEAARAESAEAEASEARAAVETILTTEYGECADAPLDPDLRDALGRLRRPAPRDGAGGTGDPGGDPEPLSR